jgi:hypothetical protein
MKTTHFRKLIHLMIFFALLVMLLPLSSATPAQARIVGDEIEIFDGLVRADVGEVGYSSGNQMFVVTYTQRSGATDYMEPFMDWYTPGGGLALSFNLASQNADAIPPALSCQPGGLICLAVWEAGGNLYARKVSYGSGMGDLWTVSEDGNVLGATVAYGASENDASFIVAWAASNGDIYMKHVDITDGPSNGYYLVPHTGTCEQMYAPDITFNSNVDMFFVAYMCPVDGGSFIQAYNYAAMLSESWCRALETPVGDEYSPQIATDNNYDLLVVWTTDIDADARIYGQWFDYNGAGYGAFQIDNFNAQANEASITYNETDDEYMVVYHARGDIYSQRLDARTLSPVGEASMVTVGANEAPTLPQVAYGAPNHYFLVTYSDNRWGEATSSVFGRWIEPSEMPLSAGQPASHEGTTNETSYYFSPLIKNQWQAIGLRPGSSGNSDLYLSDSPDYLHIVNYSGNLTGKIDLVIIDGYHSSMPGSYPYAYHVSGDTYHVIEYAPRSIQLSQSNGQYAEYVASEMVLRVVEVAVVAGQPLTLQLAPSGVDMGMALFSSTAGEVQNLNNALASSDSGTTGQVEQISFTPSQTGWLSLVVYKNDFDPGSFTLSATGMGGNTLFFYLPFAARH